MKGVVKTVIAGAVILVIGVLIIFISFAINGCSFSFLKATDFTTQTYTAENENGTLEIEIGAGKLVTQFYEGDKIVIEYPEANVITTEISENQGTLSFKSKTKWYVFNVTKIIPQTVIKIPQGAVLNLDCEVGAGSAVIADGKYADVSLELSAGSLNAGITECNKLSCDVSTGTLKISKAVCSSLECHVSAGSLSITSAACPQTKLSVSAGSATIGFPSAKSEYAIISNVSAGSCNVKTQSGTTEKKISVNVSAGSASLSFAD